MENPDDLRADETPIWRYMDLSRFVMLVSKQKLWFAKGVTLRAGDPYEGYACATAFAKEVKPGTYSAEDGLALMIANAGYLAARELNDAPHHQYVNSWCHGPESLAMWMLYGAEGRGVAIRSTVGTFVRALERKLRREQYRFGKVQYHQSVESFENSTYDFRRSNIPMSGNLWQKVLALAFNKRAAYAYEQEWRAAIYQPRREISGLYIPVELDRLIVGVHVGPRATRVEVDAVASIMKSGSLKGKPCKSVLLAPAKAVRAQRYVRSTALRNAAARRVARAGP